MLKKTRWSYEEDEICCKLYIEKFIVDQSSMPIDEFVKLLSSKIDRSAGTIRMKVQNIKQIIIEKGLVDSLRISPLAHYSPQNLTVFENLIWNASDFQIRNHILIRYSGSDEKVIIPKDVVKIGEDAFKGCDEVKHIEIPEGCLEISKGALDCKNLKTVVLPSTLKQLDRSALRDQEADYIDEGYEFREYHRVSKEIIIFSRDKSPVGEGRDIHIYKKEINKSDALTNLRRCRYVVYFNYADLRSCTKNGLQWYKTLDGSITIIGKRKAIKDKQIVIPSNISGCPVRRIGDYAFMGEYLEGDDATIVLSKNIETIGVAAFKHYQGEICLNNGIRIIGEESFFQCERCPTGVGKSSAYLLKLPTTVERIEKSAFAGCNFSILIPGNIYYIGAFAFYKMGGVKQTGRHSWENYYPIICFSTVASEDWCGEPRIEEEEKYGEISSNIIPNQCNWACGSCGWDKNWKEGVGLDAIVLDVEDIEECVIGEYGEKELEIQCKKARKFKRLVRERGSLVASVDTFNDIFKSN